MNAPQPIDWTPELVERYWRYQEQFVQTFSHRHGAALTRIVQRHVPRGGRVFDYGCGLGRLVEHLLAARFHATGADRAVDGASDVLARLRSSPRFGGLFAIDELPARDATFDAVLMVEVVEHLNGAQLAVALANVRRLARAEATVIVTTPNNERLADETVYCPVSNVTFHRWQHVRSWTATSLRAALTEAGLMPFDVFECDLALLHGMRARLVRLARRVAGHAKRPPTLIALCLRE